MAKALPVVSLSDVLQRELRSCLSLEYTPESLPLLLHQVNCADYNVIGITLVMLRAPRLPRQIEGVVRAKGDATQNWEGVLFCTLSVFMVVLCRPMLPVGPDQVPADAEMEKVLSSLPHH